MFSGLISAVRTLTILPVFGKESRDMADALPWFSVTGFLLGGILGGAAWGAGRLFVDWPEGVAALVVAAGALLTRGLHLDGLADLADGFGGGHTRERALAVMKDSRVGAFGLITVVLALLCKWVALTRLIEAGFISWIITAVVVSRGVLVELAVILPYARTEKGMAGPFVIGASSRHRWLGHLSSFILVLAAGGIAGIFALLAGFVFCRLLGIWFLRRIGGVTGDLLGATCELVETGTLLLGAGFSVWLMSLPDLEYFLRKILV